MPMEYSRGVAGGENRHTISPPTCHHTQGWGGAGAGTGARGGDWAGGGKFSQTRNPAGTPIWCWRHVSIPKYHVSAESDGIYGGEAEGDPGGFGASVCDGAEEEGWEDGGAGAVMGWGQVEEGGLGGVLGGMEWGGSVREGGTCVRYWDWCHLNGTISIQECRRVNRMRKANGSMQSTEPGQEYVRWRTMDGEWICEFRQCNNGVLKENILVKCDGRMFFESDKLLSGS